MPWIRLPAGITLGARIRPGITDTSVMTTLTVDAHRSRMLERLNAGCGDDFLTMATPYLDACPDDHYVRLMAVREYLKLGLPAPARELLHVDPSLGELPAEFASISRSLATVSGSAIPWSRWAQRFDGNLAALQERGVDVQSIREEWRRQQDHYEWFRDNRGLDQIRMTPPSGPKRWIPRLGDHRATDTGLPMPEGIKALMPGPFLFEGLDLGGYFQRVYEATRDTFLGYSCALFVVEPDPSLIALVFHLRDWRKLLSDPRVYWFIGGSCVARLQHVWNDDPDVPLPRQGFQLSAFRPAPAPNAIEVVEKVSRAREIADNESLQSLEAQYATRDLSYWARRFEDALDGRAAPLRILAAVSSHTTFLQYSMRDAQRALESLGHQCRVLTEKSPHAVIGVPTYHKVIREFDPDLFFNIDHIRPEFAGVLPSNLPLLTWDQDQLPHVFTRVNTARIGRLDFVAGWAKLKCVIAGCNPNQFLYARIPTSPEQFSGEPLSEAERRDYACDVSYVSHASQTPQAFHEEERALYPEPKLRELLDTLYRLTPPMLETHRVMWGGLGQTILDEASRRCGVQITDPELRDRLTGWYLWRLADRLFRHQALEWVAQWATRRGCALRIYGHGWQKHPTLARFAAGPAENGRELLCIYRASKINLQLMPAGFVHQRALDGLVAGGFFLSRYTPHDLRGRCLRKLIARMGRLGINSTNELVASEDAELQSLLSSYYGEWLHCVDRNRNEFFNTLHFMGELLHPDEAFDGFERILFDSASQFSHLADRFCADEEQRCRLTEEMRRVVIENFSYRPTMDRFLHAMARYLKGATAVSAVPVN